MAGAWVVFPIAVVAGNGQDKRWPANERAREFACDVRDGKEKGGRDMNERQKILGLPRLPPPIFPHRRYAANDATPQQRVILSGAPVW